MTIVEFLRAREQEAALQRLYPLAVAEAQKTGVRQRIEWVRNLETLDGGRYTGPAMVDLDARRMWTDVEKLLGRALGDLSATPSTELGPPWRAGGHAVEG